MAAAILNNHKTKKHDDNDDADNNDDDGENKGNADERLTKGLRLPLYSSDAAPFLSS